MINDSLNGIKYRPKVAWTRRWLDLDYTEVSSKRLPSDGGRLPTYTVPVPVRTVRYGTVRSYNPQECKN